MNLLLKSFRELYLFQISNKTDLEEEKEQASKLFQSCVILDMILIKRKPIVKNHLQFQSCVILDSNTKTFSDLICCNNLFQKLYLFQIVIKPKNLSCASRYIFLELCYFQY